VARNGAEFAADFVLDFLKRPPVAAQREGADGA
jgi:hypothetical protein